jgi:hypothetical protein
MYEFRYAKEHAIARTFHKALRLIKRCLLLGLMVAVSLEAQQSSPSAPPWTGLVRTAAGEPVAGANVTVFSAVAKEKITAVAGRQLQTRLGHSGILGRSAKPRGSASKTCATSWTGVGRPILSHESAIVEGVNSNGHPVGVVVRVRNSLIALGVVER